MLSMSPIHRGPTPVKHTPKPRKPPKGRRGKQEDVAKGAKQPRDHEVKAKSPRRKRGFGKIKTSGPRFKKFDSRTKF